MMTFVAARGDTDFSKQIAIASAATSQVGVWAWSVAQHSKMTGGDRDGEKNRRVLQMYINYGRNKRILMKGKPSEQRNNQSERQGRTVEKKPTNREWSSIIIGGKWHDVAMSNGQIEREKFVYRGNTRRKVALMKK
jgi:hypothetical protein